ncbi:hypothetical protein BJ508DRAFT_331206 [Ascobolus immersus RN42]|uniref:UvrD-like helicase ATP-binding domain-containing protein n=1 Tax=Ascobolus immersus RN42 TaxID=1160509 RepID=A0A3N4HWJ7_ASCIM|nr:hypothetical protein BJ508DRAFT_331206 [Ascobolus immersus RN42]
MSKSTALRAMPINRKNNVQVLGGDVGFFWTFICSKGDPKRGDYETFVKQLRQCPQSLKRPVTDAAEQTTFITALEKNTNRLLTVIDMLRGKPIFNDTVAVCVPVLLIPLVDRQYREVFEDDAFRNLMVKGISLALEANVDANLLKKLIRAFSEFETLTDRLLLDRESTTLLSDSRISRLVWKNDRETTWIFLQRAASLTTTCRADHHQAKVLSEVEQLQLVKMILAKTEKKTIAAQDNRHLLLPDLSRMRVLDKEKTDRQIKEPALQPSLAVPKKVQDMLVTLGLGVPNSTTAATLMVHEKSVELLSTLLRALPCPECLLGSGGTKQSSKAVAQAADSMEESYKTGMFCFGIWRIVCTRQAIVDLALYSRTGSRDSIEERLKLLASGNWSKRSSILNAVPQDKKATLPIFTARFGRDGLILWNVHLAYEERLDIAIQVVKVWRVGSHKEIEKSIPFILKTQRYHGDKYLKACKVRREGEIYRPAEFPLDTLEADIDTTRVKVAQDEVLRETNITDKVFTLTQNVLKGVFAGGLESEFTFDLSKEESAIIKQVGYPSFILGRSGTGKTTCLAFKLLNNYIRAKRLDLKPHGFKQIFVTRSQTLAEKLNVYIRKLVDFEMGRQSAAGSMEYDANRIKEHDNSDTSLDLLSLESESFPMVCTFDTLLNILRNTVNLQSVKKLEESRHAGRALALNQILNSKRSPREVTYEVFVRDYWDRLPCIKKGIPVDLVFAEILGIIKGSDFEAGLQCLTREAYLAASTRLAPLFQTKAQRSLVYDLYEAYERKKIEYGDWDAIDQVKLVLTDFADTKALDIANRVRHTIDEVYLDEVQDQRLVELKLLFSLVDRPDAIHLAGDTAQCVSRDSTFRFNDVKTLLYSHFEPRILHSKDLLLAKPQISKLIHNYRSHRGIVSLSSTILDMLVRGFPESIDTLDPEVGKFPGPTPLFFVGWDVKELLGGSATLVEQDVDEQNAPRIAELGENQVLITRDQEHKDAVSLQFGGDEEGPLILTILEAKGMEFDSVIINEYFSHRQDLHSHYRALEGLSKGQTFDSMKHSVLCAELKSLYVAVTRCKANLVFVEPNREVSEAVLRLWAKEEPFLVDAVRPGDEDADIKIKALRSGSATDPETWLMAGRLLLERQSYKGALQCFLKGNDAHGQSIARAHLARIQAENALQKGAPQQQIAELFGKAADLFDECEFLRNAHECYLKAGLLEKAAAICVKQGPEKFNEAAELFLQAKNYELASYYYEHQDNFTEAAEVLARGRKYDLFLNFLIRSEQKMKPQAFKRYAHYLNMLIAKNGKKLSKETKVIAASLLRSDDEKEAFFREQGMEKEIVDLLMSQKRYHEVRRLYFDKGAFEDVIRVPQLEPLDEESRELRSTSICYLAMKDLDGQIQRDHQGKALSASPIYDDSTYLEKLGELTRKNETIGTAYSGVLSRKTNLKVGQLRGWDYTLGFMAFRRVYNMVLDEKRAPEGTELTLMLRLVVSLLDSTIDELVKNPPTELPAHICVLLGIQEIMPRRGAAMYTIRECSLLHINSAQFSQIEFEEFGETFKLVAVDQVRSLLILMVLRYAKAVFDLGYHMVFDKAVYTACGPLNFVGQCRFKEECPLSHQKFTPEVFGAHLTKVFALCVLVCGLKKLFQTAKNWGVVFHNESSLAKEIDGRRGKALEFFMQQLLYVSAVDQDGRAAFNSFADFQVIRKDLIQQYEYLRRNERFWDRRRDLRIVEDLQLARAIDMPGQSVNQFIWRQFNLLKASAEIRDAYNMIPSLEGSFVRHAEPEQIRTYLEYVKRLSSSAENFSELHALVTLFERLSVYLILGNGPFEHLMLSSWEHRHYPKVQEAVSRSPLHGPAFTTTQPSALPIFGKLLLLLTTVLLKVLVVVEPVSGVSGYRTRFRFKVLGTDDHAACDPSRVLRRALDLILVNLYNLNGLVSQEDRAEYRVLWGTLGKFLLDTKFWTMGYSINSDNSNRLLDQPQRILAGIFVDSMRSYSQKESLVLVQGRVVVSRFRSLEAFKTLPSRKLKEFFSLSGSPQGPTQQAASEQPISIDSTTTRDTVDSAFTAEQVSAAKRILSFFRLHYPDLVKARTYRRSVEGQQFSHVSSIIKHLMDIGKVRQASVVCASRKKTRKLIASLTKEVQSCEETIEGIDILKSKLITGDLLGVTESEFDAFLYEQCQTYEEKVITGKQILSTALDEFIGHSGSYRLFGMQFGTTTEYYELLLRSGRDSHPSAQVGIVEDFLLLRRSLEEKGAPDALKELTLSQTLENSRAFRK